ncbi:16S rRNA (cytosine(1402)-N(4))-methyltransferase RsmH [Xanthovirga aplysinae]|uniref:16S rRNA (cytosine(1402)-N(4))-methyltransferase RsmH n=1 Tax=Xanthovirga aplysinae TaxID=2529853 RepID=UPI0012BBC824|nr:16S rRNA (cytosine(1402)-N(4))-methyltransferase RsmH [Xanthovirga aplysinae]MTI32865.1 16S rRNA (cytosine(1402)-N(4))-methyltransferase RsmH [Xanthovirga aplysinae]
MEYHQPVMLRECIEGLEIKPDGIYVDLTFGGGGHSRSILQGLENGKLFAFDQDVDAKQNAEAIENPCFTFIQANFRYLKRYLKLHGISKVDGVLADLGVSSHQFDVAERGFSTRFDAELDMRMDQDSELTAKKVINEYSEADLHRIFGMYGEVKNARSLASAIVTARINRQINTINDLKEILSRFVKRGKENKYYAQVFQALRIEVNQEMIVLEEALQQCADVIRPGGKLVVMSYHSLEDRMVKQFVQKGKFFGEVEKDFYGNELKPFQAKNKKPIVASQEEVAINNRARSAKLRIAERTDI